MPSPGAYVTLAGKSPVRGKPARLAIVTDDGKVIVASDLVAKEAEAAAINSDRNCLAFRGHLKV